MEIFLVIIVLVLGPFLRDWLIGIWERMTIEPSVRLERTTKRKEAERIAEARFIEEEEERHRQWMKNSYFRAMLIVFILGMLLFLIRTFWLISH